MGSDTGVHPVEHLFTLLNQFGSYPTGAVPIHVRIAGTAFFPGGWGLWGTQPDQPLPALPVGGVMVLGHNFDSETGYAASLRRGVENLNGPTWRTLQSVLTRAGIALDRCFFTNAYIGLKAGSVSTGFFPGARDADFVRRCQQFLREQLRVQQPRLVLTLGNPVPPVLAPLAPGLQLAWLGARGLRDIDQRDAALVAPVQFPDVPHTAVVIALTHPANRGPNVLRRRYRGFEGDAAEQALLHDALARIAFSPVTGDSSSCR